MFWAAPALLTIHPIHVLSEPIARHEGHAPLDDLVHGIQLAAAWAHLQDHLFALLADGGGEGEISVLFIETLTVGEGLCAVDGRLASWAEIAPMGLQLRVTPLVALPIWVSSVVVCARMVCDLLHLVVTFVHVKLRATSQTRETLRIAIMVVILACLRHWHVHKIEIQVAST